MPRKPWKNKEVKAGLPVKTDKEMKVLAANIEEAIGEGKASKHDVATWVIHWFLTQDFKHQLKIAVAGKAIEETFKPPKGRSNPDSTSAPSRATSATGTTKVWTNRIKSAHHDGTERFEGHGVPAREMSNSPGCE